MMLVALLADVHANLPALRAVLAEISRLDVQRVICLGDLVGYNAQPQDCVDLVRAAAHVVVAGNHDREVSGTRLAAGTNHLAREVIAWTRTHLDGRSLAYLAALPNRAEDEAGIVCVHGCFLNESHYKGYVTSTMLADNLEIVSRGGDRPAIAACGHTHVPMCAWLAGGEVHERDLSRPAEWPAEADAVLVNPGAVGQPRDGDPRAAFALVDLAARRVELRRVTYDIEAAATAITRAGLSPALCSRLREGR